MSKQRRQYTTAEIELANKMFANAKVNGTLKAPSAIAALAIRNGYRQTITQSEVTFRNYLRDARQALAERGGR